MKRLCEATQLLLVLVSAIGAIGATCATEPVATAAYHADDGRRGHRTPDRRFTDLGRLDRRSREERQHAIGRAIASRRFAARDGVSSRCAD
jgi:hypothetical protein